MTSAHKIIIITAPSGSGKTTIVRHLLDAHAQLMFSISACTRLPRNYEKNGVDYYFISPEEFKQKIIAGEFAEYEMVYEGKYYGTLKAELERIWNMNKTPLVDIDVKGALSLQAYYPANALTIFIEPPSIEVLRERLSARGTETKVSLEERIIKASYELTFASRFDKVLINDNLSETLRHADALAKAFLQS